MDKATDSASWIPSLVPTLISAFLTFLFGVTGVLIGGSWQQRYAIQLEQQKDLLELRRKAYSDFFEGQTTLARLNTDLTGLYSDETARLHEKYATLVWNARFHIAVYSSRSTVEALSDFYEKYFPPGDCPDATKFREDTNIYIRMREEHFGNKDEDKVAPEKMTLLIHDCRLSRGAAANNQP
jgi:hypothetical protein